MIEKEEEKKGAERGKGKTRRGERMEEEKKEKKM